MPLNFSSNFIFS